jgi:hypothetical protein
MGYTRYWDIKKDLDDYRFLKFKEFCNQIVELFDIPLEDIVITDNVVRFNGVDDDAHETFVFSKKSGFNFCKTQRKPYDAVVCACLLTAMDIFGSDISFSSDGDNNDDKVKENLKSLIRDRKLNNIL